MSEYQYYEFLAVDRPLTPEQMAELRSISSRARITTTRLTNTYSYGDFRGDPLELVTSYFDAHVYVANWGSYTLILGFPKAAVDVQQLKQYAVDALSDYDDGVSVQERDDRVLVIFSHSDEDGGGWMDEDEAEGWMPSLIQLRADIMNGDLRAMYLGWLAGATVNLEEYADQDEDELDDVEAEALDASEPPMPDGLGALTAPLRKLAEFLWLDAGMISVAADRSPKLAASEPDDAAVSNWIAGLVSAEKDELLTRVVSGDTTVGAELRRRLRAALQPAASPSEDAGSSRTVRDLVLAGRDRANELERRRIENEKRRRQERLERLAPNAEASWRRVEALIEQKQARPYDEAVDLLKDLSDLAEYQQQKTGFSERLSGVRTRHRAKTSFIQRLDKAGLR